MRRPLLYALVVAALLAPAYAAASQIVLPGVTETVLEGHTVFTVIEKVRLNETVVEAAAVAVLVREEVRVQVQEKGVLWFNDQYLVSPFFTPQVLGRWPCGGAVLAVNEGDPDPRTLLVSKDDDPATASPHENLFRRAVDNSDRLLVVSGDQRDVLQSLEDWERDPADIMPPAAGGSWLDVDLDTQTVSTSTPTAVVEYNESYLVTDPNDHVWIVDKYLGITTLAVDLTGPAVAVTASARFPIWAVNMLGKPAFSPDDGVTSCAPFVDDPWGQGDVNNAFADVETANCVTDPCPLSAGPGVFGDPADPLVGLDAKPPAIGYYERTDPDTNGGVSYCYDGRLADGVNEFRVPGSGCRHAYKQNGLRQYNTVLYFFLGPEDVRITSAAPHGDTDTNGCDSNVAPHQDVALQWLCPDFDGDGAPDTGVEGNSHPFNPPGVYVPQTWNPTTSPPTPLAGGYWIDVWAGHRLCSLGHVQEGSLLETGGRAACHPDEHATHNRGRVDLYFSGTARPLEPPARHFVVVDLEGRLDEFHENNQPQPRLHPGNVPPQRDFDPR